MLPDFLAPYKHYQEEVIVDAIDGRLDPADVEEQPSVQTVNHWKWWIRLNALDIDGNLKSIGCRELGFNGELLESGISLLEELRRSLPEGWLRTILRILYNAGARLCPVYG